MRSEWVTEPLQGVVSYIAKGIPPAYVEVEDDNTVRVLNQKCNRNFAINYAESRLHDLRKRKVPQEKFLLDEDILINSTGTGTAGRIAQLNIVPYPTIVDGHMIVIRGNAKVTPRYLGYALKAQQSAVLQLDEGSTGQTELNRDRLLAEIEISYPVSLDEQEVIASTFSALDARIAENTKINHHLAARSVTDSSPDISFGSKVSRIAARRADSALFACIRKNIGLTASSKLARSSLLGSTISKALRTAVVMLGTAEPTFIPAKSRSRTVKYTNFATLGHVICV